MSMNRVQMGPAWEVKLRKSLDLHTSEKKNPYQANIVEMMRGLVK